MKYSAKERSIIKTHLRIAKVVDGDSLILSNIFNLNLENVRLLGIDAPESSRSRKLFQDERETHMAGQLLMELGKLSFMHLFNFARIEESVTIKIEATNSYDVYGRTLAYIYMADGTCVNEMKMRCN